MGAPAFVAPELDEFESLTHAPPGLGGPETLELWPAGDACLHSQGGVERRPLKDRVRRPPMGRSPAHPLAANEHLSGRRQLESRDDPQRRRLAAPAGPEERKELPPLDGERHLV